VPREEFARRDYYDVWLPELAPSTELVAVAQDAHTDSAWGAFVRAYRKEMSRPEARHLLLLLAALSQTSNLSVGCYCEDENRCHRGVLQELLEQAGADLA
jgi:uncharacterized protein YeaO (DUF488 family)